MAGGSLPGSHQEAGLELPLASAVLRPGPLRGAVPLRRTHAAAAPPSTFSRGPPAGCQLREGHTASLTLTHRPWQMVGAPYLPVD